MNKPKVSALILLAGNSTRFNAPIKKQFFEINGKPLFFYAVNSFESCKKVDEIILVCDSSSISKVKELITLFNFKKVTNVVEGGKTRQNSVYNGLKELKCSNDDIVIIHDGARPLVPEKVIDNCIIYTIKFGAVTTAIKVEDTLLKNSKDGFVDSYLNRDEIMRVQTPQSFKYSLIKKAHEQLKDFEFTDDSQMIKKLNINIKIVEGSKITTKITTIEDINYIKEVLDNE